MNNPFYPKVTVSTLSLPESVVIEESVPKRSNKRSNKRRSNKRSKRRSNKRSNRNKRRSNKRRSNKRSNRNKRRSNKNRKNIKPLHSTSTDGDGLTPLQKAQARSFGNWLQPN